MNITGTVKYIIRYPIKSLGGEYIDETNVDENGIEGDRTYAFKDEDTGLIVSTKNPKKWKKIIELSAFFKKKKLVVKNYELNELFVDKEKIEGHIHKLTSKKVTLITTTDVTNRQIREADRSPVDKLGTVINQEPLALASKEKHFFDFAPIHILTTASLKKINSFYKEGNFGIARFRPNLVVDTGEQIDFVENDWIGKQIKIGEHLTIKIIEPCPRCVVTTLKQGKMKRDINILKTIVEYSAAQSHTFFPGKTLKGVLGVYGVIEKSGTIKTGDQAKLMSV